MERKRSHFFVFKGAKRETKALNEEFCSNCIVASSASGWKNDEITEGLYRGSWHIHLWSMKGTTCLGLISLSFVTSNQNLA